MQGTNILKRLEDDYRGKMTDGKMFEDDRIETNIVGEHSVMKLLKGKNIHPVGGTGGDGITKTREFLKDVDAHMIRQLTIESEGDSPEDITFNIILGSCAPPILGSQYMSPQTRMYTTSTVTNKEYVENIHVSHGHIQARQLTETFIPGHHRTRNRKLWNMFTKTCPVGQTTRYTSKGHGF